MNILNLIQFNDVKFHFFLPNENEKLNIFICKSMRHLDELSTHLPLMYINAMYISIYVGTSTSVVWVKPTMRKYLKVAN